MEKTLKHLEYLKDHVPEITDVEIYAFPTGEPTIAERFHTYDEAIAFIKTKENSKLGPVQINIIFMLLGDGVIRITEIPQ